MEPSVLFTGYAKFPARITADEIYHFLCVSLELERETGTIINADCTLVTELSRKFFSRIICGYSILHDLETMEKVLEDRYHGNARRAIITAMRRIREQYIAYSKKNKKEGLDHREENYS